ncbi:MAG: hypothetical protein U0Q16_04310 [Bryobacteraceae bacterium]
MPDRPRPVVVFGAGATKDCGGPLTDEILLHGLQGFRSVPRPHAYEREDFFGTVEHFLTESFHLPPYREKLEKHHFPSLPLLLSLIDTAIDRGQPLGGRSPEQLREVRGAIEYLMFAVLQEHLRGLPANNSYGRFLVALARRFDIAPRVITLNYDLIADGVLFDMAVQASKRGGLHRLPDYDCEIATEAYAKRPHDYGLLLKLHGSLNWLYCPDCQRLDIGLSAEGSRLQTRKVLDDLYREVNLHDRYSCRGAPCVRCGTDVRPVLITPTHRKDYRNPHIARVWYRAEQVLREATDVFLIGYSLPADDVEVIYLLKRGLAGSKAKITVVQYDPGKKLTESEVGQRYRSLFGDRITWWNEGFGTWVTAFEKNKRPKRRSQK